MTSALEIFTSYVSVSYLALESIQVWFQITMLRGRAGIGCSGCECPALFAYSTNWLVDIDAGIIVDDAPDTTAITTKLEARAVSRVNTDIRCP
jgi:hypothetical protein